MKNKKRILVTGGTGFIGAHLLVHLYQSGVAEIRATYRRPDFSELEMICGFYGVRFSELYRAIEWVRVDLLDPVALDRSMWDVTEVYHCAALVSFSDSDAEQLLKNNIEGTRNLVKACLRKEIQKTCYISSIGALNGVNEAGYTDETCFEEPVSGSVYSKSKHFAEREIWEGIEQGLSVVVLNPGIVLGYGNINKGSLRFFETARKGMIGYTTGVTGYVDVRDVCRAALTCMDKEYFNERMLLVSENLSYQQLLTTLSKSFGKRPPFIKAGKNMLQAVLLFSRLKQFITGRPSRFTRETLHSSLKKSRYDASATRNKLGIEFIPMDRCIRDVADKLGR